LRSLACVDPEARACRTPFDKRACGRDGASLKPGQVPWRPPMLGIAAIVIFIAVIAILNRVEFGRFD